MATIQSYPHIVKENGEPARLESHPRTRVALLVMDYLGRGLGAEDMVRHYPSLKRGPQASQLIREVHRGGRARRNRWGGTGRGGPGLTCSPAAAWKSRSWSGTPTSSGPSAATTALMSSAVATFRATSNAAQRRDTTSAHPLRAGARPAVRATCQTGRYPSSAR
jgi:hypothetical protein